MGQGQSSPPPPRTHEELVKELANRFATKCFTALELYSLKDNFKSLADATEDSPPADRDHEHGEDDGDEQPQEHRKRHVLRYLKEDTVARFLAVPDILGASPVVFQMLTYLGAFPFLGDAPAVLGLEQLVIVVTLLTDRYRRVLEHGATDRRTLLFRSLAVHDRKLFAEDKKEAAEEQGGEQRAAGGKIQTSNSTTLGFAVDAAVEDEFDADGDDNDDSDPHGEDDDDLVLAAFEALDYTNQLPTDREGPPKRKAGTAAALHGARIPADNFRKLLMLLLLVAPLGPQEQLSLYAGRFTGEALDSLRATAQCILATFLDVETSPGIKFAHFDAIIPVCFPFLFGGFNALFEHFLFSKNLDLSRMRPGAGGTGGYSTSDPNANANASANNNGAAARRKSSQAASIPPKDIPLPPLLLQDSDNTIMNLNLLSQLSFFIPGATLFHRLRLLYSGDSDGFSMGSFETRVFNWRAPTILLVKGTRVSDTPRGGPEAAFAAALPPRRLPHGNGRPASSFDKRNGNSDNDDDDYDDDTLIFGAYVSQPWRLTNRECFGDGDVVLFQLSPVHDVFGASAINRDYAAFVKPSAANQHAGGIGFGCPPPSGAAAKAAMKQRRSSMSTSSSSSAEGVLPLGPLSLMIDANLEFGVLTHDRGHDGARGGGGGAFHASVARAFSFQDRFAIEALEVWGCGGDAEAQAQAERWAWEAREAEARRRINLGTGDIEADRALLEMAGLIGGNGSRSGGSMG